MSRRKQAKPRAVFKSSDADEELANLESACTNNDDDIMEHDHNSGSDTMGSDPSLSWNSEETLLSSAADDDDDDECATSSSCEIIKNNNNKNDNVDWTIGPTESTPYSCQFCEKAFARLSYLKKHEQSHSDQMPFKCDFCQRLFKHKRSRDRHVKLHTGDKKYRCPHCESAFSRSDHLKIHLKTHDHQKPYQCVICNRGYNTAAALTSHMQNHKKQEPNSTVQQQQVGQFRCLECNSTFNTGDDLQTHVTINHSSKLNNRSSSSPQSSSSSSSSPSSSLPPPTTTNSSSSTRVDPIIMRLMTKLACIYCAKDSFNNMEALQLHVQALHGPILNGEIMMSSLLPPLPLPLPPPHHPQQNNNNPDTEIDDTSKETNNNNCNFCTMKFSDLSTLHKHIIQVHQQTISPPPPPLPIINSLSYNSNKSKENIFCASCSITFQNNNEYTKHLTHHHHNVIINNQLNNIKQNDQEDQQSPTDLSNKKPPPPSPPPTNNNHNNHEECSPKNPVVVGPPPSKKPKQELLLCNQCNVGGFSDFESFRSHLKSHIEKVEQKFICNQCESLSEFNSEEELQDHSMVHYLSTSTEYGCQSCLKLFTKPDELQKHLLDIHAHHLYRCSLCKDVFDSKVSIQVHFAVRHSNECKLFRCSNCSINNNNSTIFRSELEFQMHVRLIHMRSSSSSLFRCLLCASSFNSELELKFHLNSHEKQFHCKLCDESFHVEFLLDKHLQTHFSTPTTINKCDKCDKLFESQSELLIHNKIHHHNNNDLKKQLSSTNNSRFSLSCAYCSEVCKSRVELENHMKTVHQVIGGKNKCNICDEIFFTSTLLAEHKLSHCKVSHNKCTGCNFNINNPQLYLQHMKQHNNNVNSYPTPCIICRQTLQTDIELNLHCKFHTNNNKNISCCLICFQENSDSLVCNNCVKKSDVKKEKTYECIVCQLNFNSEEEVQSHVVSVHLCKSETNECHLCNKLINFDTPLKLQCHLILEHTFEGCNSFNCYICSAVFTNVNTLQSHMIEHGVNYKPYDCSQCKLKFFFRSELENHHLQSHKAKNTNFKKKNSYKTKTRKKFYYRSDSDSEGEGEGAEDKV